MDRVDIKSATSNSKLSLHSCTSDGFVVEFNNAELHVVKPVAAFTDLLGLAHFFQELALFSLPWTDVKQWTAPLEAEFSISARCDVRGHVLLEPSFNYTGGPEEWRAMASLNLEFGQLQAVAGSVVRFFNCGTANQVLQPTNSPVEDRS